MNSQIGSKEKSKTLERQKSVLELLPTRRMQLNRSKTPPPRLNHGIQTTSKDDITRQVSAKNVASTSASYRSRPLVTRSIEELNLVNHSKVLGKSNKESTNREDLLALRYNAYLQSCLLIAHSRNAMKRKENKVIKQLEELQTKLLDVDDKMNHLKINSEKLKLYKRIKEKFVREIQDFEDLNNSINLTQIDERVNILEGDLNIIQLKNFYVPNSPEAPEEINRHIKGINEDLKMLPNLEKKMLPLSQLHSSINTTRENIQEEARLRKKCEKKLKEAEESLIHECFTKSLNES